MELSFSQSWLAKSEPSFRPGTARIRIIRGRLHFTAELVDDEVMTTATAHQQRLWELGDVVELFVQRVDDEDYYEYQIAPNGMTLALHYPNREAVARVRSGEEKMEEYLSELPIESSASLTPAGWTASLSIPLLAVPGDRLRINCGRYDYGSGHPPVISSTSTLSKCDFHRLEDWREMVLMEE